jgi:hypothetical protein
MTVLMSRTVEMLGGHARASAPTSLAGLQQVILTNGLIAAAASAAAAFSKIALSRPGALI